jgi:hypothetical protein
MNGWVICLLMNFLMSPSPIFPPSGPATGSSNGLHRESNFLAAELPTLKIDKTPL